MATYYVGKGGDNGNSGLTWALRKLTLNGAEDIPVVADDVVYIGPGIYREAVTIDVSGGSSTPIDYIGDVTGVNTDGVGGQVLLTGSEDDETIDYGMGLSMSSKNYRRFYNLNFEMYANACIEADASTGILIENCAFGNSESYENVGVRASSFVASGDVKIRNCVFAGCGLGINFSSLSDITATNGSGVFNCIFINCSSNTTRSCVQTANVSNLDIDNITVIGGLRGISTTSLATSIDVDNSIFLGVGRALIAQSSGEIVEDYNSIYNSEVPRTLVSTGSNSDERFMYPKEATLFSLFKLPYNMLELSQLSTLRNIGTSAGQIDDLFSLLRPTTTTKRSRGAAQFHNAPIRDEITTHQGTDASIKLPDATRYQMFVPVSAVSTTITVYCYREANYAGTLPQMVIKEPGQTDRTTVDTGSVATWNQLSDTFTPSGDVDYVIVELVSNNTATSGSYAVYFDTVEGV